MGGLRCLEGGALCPWLPVLAPLFPGGTTPGTAAAPRTTATVSWEASSAGAEQGEEKRSRQNSS